MPDNDQRRTQSVYPSLAFRDCAKALEFYKKAFGARIDSAVKAPQGMIVHAEFAIGSTVLMASDEYPQAPVRAPSGPTVTGAFYVYVDDVDAFIKEAVAAGAKATMPLTDMFYGDRMGGLVDPFGYHWTFATHKEDVSEEEVERRSKAFFASMGKPK